MVTKSKTFIPSVLLKNPSDFSWIKTGPSLSKVDVLDEARRAISSLLKIIFLPLDTSWTTEKYLNICGVGEDWQKTENNVRNVVRGGLRRLSGGLSLSSAASSHPRVYCPLLTTSLH